MGGRITPAVLGVACLVGLQYTALGKSVTVDLQARWPGTPILFEALEYLVRPPPGVPAPCWMCIEARPKALAKHPNSCTHCRRRMSVQLCTRQALRLGPRPSHEQSLPVKMPAGRSSSTHCSR